MAITTEIVNSKFQIRQGDMLDWNDENPTLLSGEPGVAWETDINGNKSYAIKLGDGNTPWKDLQGFSTKYPFVRCFGNSAQLKDISPLSHEIKTRIINKNLITLPYKTLQPHEQLTPKISEIAGITFTIGDNGIIRVQGKLNRERGIFFKFHEAYIPKGIYTISGGPSDSRIGKYYMFWCGETSSDPNHVDVEGTNRTVTILKDYAPARFYILIETHDEIDLVFAPQLEVGTKQNYYYIPGTNKLKTTWLLNKNELDIFSFYNKNNWEDLNPITHKYQLALEEDTNYTFTFEVLTKQCFGNISICTDGQKITIWEGESYGNNEPIFYTFQTQKGKAYWLEFHVISSSDISYMWLEKGTNSTFQQKIYGKDEIIYSSVSEMSITPYPSGAQIEAEYNTNGYNDRDRLFTNALGDIKQKVTVLEEKAPIVEEQLEEIHDYMIEHGGSWDAIELESAEANKQFMFEANTKTLRHITQDDADSTKIASGLIYNAGQNGSASFTGSNPDNMIVSGKSTFGVGRNIKVEANYACALGSHHNVTGYGAFAGGTGNILTTLANNNGSTKNSQYATAFGQQVGTIGAASFSAGTGDSAISNFVQNLTASNSKEEVYNEWIALNRGKRPSISWGDWSARFGSYNISIGNNSFVTGGYNAAVGDYSAAFGENTFVLHDHSFVCGSNNLVDWKESFAAGSNNKVYDQRSLVVGGNNIAGIKGRCAEQEKEEEENNIPEGNRKIIGYNAVFGQNNSALSTHGFISGYNNTIAEAGTTHSGIIGMGNYIGNGGWYSFVAGLNNISHNNGAMVLGAGLISSSNYSLTVGRLNKEVSGGLFVVGNGTGDVKECSINQTTNQIEYKGATPANAFVVYQDGHAEVQTQGKTKNSIAQVDYVDTKTKEVLIESKEYSDELAKQYVDTNAADITYDGSEQYIGGSTVEEALNNASNYIAEFTRHVHNATDVGCNPYDRNIRTLKDALDCLFAELDGFSEALDELHAYAQGLVNGGAAE